MFLTRCVCPATVPHLDCNRNGHLNFVRIVQDSVAALLGSCMSAYICAVIGLLFLSMGNVVCTLVVLRTGRRNETEGYKCVLIVVFPCIFDKYRIFDQQMHFLLKHKMLQSLFKIYFLL